MPILSVSFGYSETTFVYIQDDFSVKTFTYPYKCTSKLFIKDLMKIALKEFDLKLEDTSLGVLGFPEVPDFLPEAKLVITLDRLIKTLFGYYGIFVSKLGVISSQELQTHISLADANFCDQNELLNTIIYPQIVEKDDLSQIALDHLYRFLPNTDSGNDDRPILFTGERFNVPFDTGDASVFLLMLDLVKTPGIHSLYLDSKNAAASLVMAGLMDTSFSKVFSTYEFKNVALLVNVPGGGESLVEYSDGSRKIVDLKKDEIFVLPVEVGSSVRILTRGALGKSIEKTIISNGCGIIFDSRPKDNLKKFNKILYDNGYSAWKLALEDVKCTLR